MPTVRKNISRRGFCKVDQENVSIPIEYVSLPHDDGDQNIEYVKNNNLCSYLTEGKCRMEKECEIYKNSDDVIVL